MDASSRRRVGEICGRVDGGRHQQPEHAQNRADAQVAGPPPNHCPPPPTPPPPARQQLAAAGNNAGNRAKLPRRATTADEKMLKQSLPPQIPQSDSWPIADHMRNLALQSRTAASHRSGCRYVTTRRRRPRLAQPRRRLSRQTETLHRSTTTSAHKGSTPPARTTAKPTAERQQPPLTGTR